MLCLPAHAFLDHLHLSHEIVNDLHDFLLETNSDLFAHRGLLIVPLLSEPMEVQLAHVGVEPLYLRKRLQGVVQLQAPIIGQVAHHLEPPASLDNLLEEYAQRDRK